LTVGREADGGVAPEKPRRYAVISAWEETSAQQPSPSRPGSYRSK
jgi:hypothetical protein